MAKMNLLKACVEGQI